MESLEEGNGVLIIHDHMLTPEQQKLADKAIGEPVYFKTLISREDAIRRKEQSNSESEEEQQKDEFPQKESETFTLCGSKAIISRKYINPGMEKAAYIILSVRKVFKRYRLRKRY